MPWSAAGATATVAHHRLNAGRSEDDQPVAALDVGPAAAVPDDRVPGAGLPRADESRIRPTPTSAASRTCSRSCRS